MSDVQWVRVAAILTADDPAVPANARALLDAIILLALTGTPWEELPSDDPAPAEVAAVAARWRELGLLTRLEAVLLIRLGV
jgi:transposase